MQIRDSRLVVGLFLVITGVSVLILAATYDSINVGAYFSNLLSNARAYVDANENVEADPEPVPIPSDSALARKCTQPGVLNCFTFDSSSGLYYNWPVGTACDYAFKGQTNYRFGNGRQGRGNTVAVIQNGQCLFPQIDSTTAHSGAGSLKITIPSNSSADSGGHFTEVFKRNRDGNPAGIHIGPGSRFGNVLYFQFYQRFDDNFLSTNFACSRGECGGWKQAIWYGNPPNGRSASSLEVTMNNGWQRGVPQMYGQVGSDYYGIQDARGCTYKADARSGTDYMEPPCIRYKPNQWMEFTGRIEILGESNQPSSRVQLWIDGELAIDYKRARIDWSGASGEGFGQFLLSPYHTDKNPSEVHPIGHVWYDDLIISTQPIAVAGRGASVSPANTAAAPH